MSIVTFLQFHSGRGPTMHGLENATWWKMHKK